MRFGLISSVVMSAAGFIAVFSPKIDAALAGFTLTFALSTMDHVSHHANVTLIIHTLIDYVLATVAGSECCFCPDGICLLTIWLGPYVCEPRASNGMSSCSLYRLTMRYNGRLGLG